MSRIIKLWKLFWRRIFTLPFVQVFTGIVCYGLINFIRITSKLEYRNAAEFRKMVGKPVIFVMWHGRSLMPGFIARHFGFKGYAIFSRHLDGRLVAKMYNLFGMHGIYGSSGKSGAVAVLIQGARILKNGNLLCIAVDGPRGPYHYVHDGAIFFAKTTGAPIIPVCFSSTKPWFQNRWDKYLIPLPFSRVVFDAGKPITIPRDMDLEEARKIVTNAMEKQERDLDKSVIRKK